MIETFTFFSSAGIAYILHNFFERFLNTKFQRQVCIKMFGYHIHHSCFGITAILFAIIFTNGVMMMLMLGYGTGNLWQHKITHNRVNEKGFVFLTKL